MVLILIAHAQKPYLNTHADVYRRARGLTFAVGFSACADPEGGGGAVGPDPPENYKNIGFLDNNGPDPLKITKLPIQHSMLGHQRPASETPFKWRFAGGPLMAR